MSQLLRAARATIEGGFWAPWQKLNREVSLGHGFAMLERAGNFHNLRLAAGIETGEYRGPVFMDSDVYKWLEAVAYAWPDGLNREVLRQADEAIGLVEAAQAPDGYLDSYYQVVAAGRRWQELGTGHELYCAGHLIQAAVAWHRFVDDDRLLDVGRRVIDHVGAIFGPGKRIGVPGHPEVEMALVELYRATGQHNYLELAQFFVNERGYGSLGPRFGGPAYYQDSVPVRGSSTIEGHAVRAMYLLCGATDLYLETGEQALLDAVLRQWSDFVGRKMYITGGAGSRHTGEAFGHPFELPADRAYCETCAAIGSVMWNWRLLLATGEGRFADLIERTLYNGFLSGVALDGEHYFYVNPLLSYGEPEIVGRGGVQRQPWFEVACCPPNVMRLIGSLGHYAATTDNSGVQLHQYISGTIEAQPTDARRVRLHVESEYPWRETISVRVDDSLAEQWACQLRIPGWCSGPRLRLNGAPLSAEPAENGYVCLERVWHVGDRIELDLPMGPRLIEPHPRVESSRGSVAIERGPLVYCLEQSDHPAANVLDVCLDASTPLREEWRPDLLGGIVTIDADGGVADLSDWGGTTFRCVQPRGEQQCTSVTLKAIPYYAWANRATGPMRVWIPRA